MNFFTLAVRGTRPCKHNCLILPSPPPHLCETVEVADHESAPRRAHHHPPGRHPGQPADHAQDDPHTQDDTQDDPHTQDDTQDDPHTQNDTQDDPHTQDDTQYDTQDDPHTQDDTQDDPQPSPGVQGVGQAHRRGHHQSLPQVTPATLDFSGPPFLFAPSS